MALQKLTAVKVKNAAPGKYADGGGLWLVKRVDGGGQWVLRVTIHGRRREMGLGSIEAVSLKEVRETAEQWRAVVRQGKDPIKERERQRHETAKGGNTLANVAVKHLRLARLNSRVMARLGDGFPRLNCMCYRRSAKSL